MTENNTRVFFYEGTKAQCGIFFGQKRIDSQWKVVQGSAYISVLAANRLTSQQTKTDERNLNRMGTTFSQKRINHIFHYTQSFDTLTNILRAGFIPSYCEEKITDLTYLIPMVSFCNISIRDVDLYMRYNNYGIGLTIDWALRNRISPVIYIHETSPFNNLHRQINEILLWDLVNRQMDDAVKQFEEAQAKGEPYNYQADGKHTKLLADINQLTVPALQFFKNWKTDYKGNEIITYQEREWRYIPELTEEKKIILSSEPEFESYNKDVKPKPHLPEHVLQISSVADLRYIIIRTEEDRNGIIQCLNERFGDQNVLQALVNGALILLTDEQVRNDF